MEKWQKNIVLEIENSLKKLWEGHGRFLFDVLNARS